MRLNLCFLVFFLFSIPLVNAAEKIEVNTAPLEDLVKIIHIGEKRAQELITLRPFHSLDELTKIRGIGEKRVKDIKEQGLAYVENSPRPKTESEQQQIVHLKTLTHEEEGETQLEPDLIDINTASLEDLQKIAGVGPVLAQRIIDTRPFYSLDDLLLVEGIGEKTLQKIKEQGLVWIEEKKEKIGDEKEIEKMIAVMGKTIGNQEREEVQNPIFIFLVALAAAIFFSFAIIILKSKHKNKLLS